MSSADKVPLFLSIKSSNHFLVLSTVMSLGIDVSTKSGVRRLSMEGSTQKVHESATLAGFEAINSLMITSKTGANIFERTFYSEVCIFTFKFKSAVSYLS